jgi:hypothetical protein
VIRLEELLQRIQSVRTPYSGMLYTIKDAEYPPWLSSGIEGRFNGAGTNAIYASQDLRTCWLEKTQGTARNPAGFKAWEFRFTGTVADIGSLGSRYVAKKDDGGWLIAREICDLLPAYGIVGIQNASCPAFQSGSNGTNLVIYESAYPLSQSCFKEIPNWYERLTK